ncbi:MAG: glycosyltransferase family 2 protein [Chloroflexota bacterium]
MERTNRVPMRVAELPHRPVTVMDRSDVGSASEQAGARIPTPLAWRVAAVAVLAGGLVVGFEAAGGSAARWIVILFASVLVVGLVPILIGSRRPPITPGALARTESEILPTILVLVAGRDEAGVLPNLIADLGAQDYREPDGKPRFAVTVVDDRSGDGTGDAVRTAAAAHGIASVVRVVRREGPALADGKGAALASARPEAADAEVIAILDADARIGAGYLRRAAQYVAAGVPALTARRRTLQAGRSTLATIQADEQTQDGELQRGRWASGGCSEFRGNGIVIRRDLLAAVGGIPAASLTEDLDLSTRLAAERGVTVAWALDLEAWEEAVPSWRGLWRQRLRWSEGAIRRQFQLGPGVLRSSRLPLRGRWDFAAYGAQLVAPPLILGAVAGALAFRSPMLAVGLIASYLAAGGILAFSALRWQPDGQGRPLRIPERLARSTRVALFSTIWLAAVNGALWRLATRRGSVRFDKTARGSAGPSAGPATITHDGTVGQ